MIMSRLFPSSSRKLRIFFKSHNFFIMEKWGILGQSWNIKFHKVKLLKFKTENSHFSIMKKLWDWKKISSLPGAGRTRAWNYHGSATPTSPSAIYVLKSAKGPNLFCGECMLINRWATLITYDLALCHKFWLFSHPKSKFHLTISKWNSQF